MTEFVTPHLRTVLKSYQDSAPKTLQGPGLSLPHHSIINNNIHYNQHIHKRELESPTFQPFDNCDNFKHPHRRSPSPSQQNASQITNNDRSPRQREDVVSSPILPQPILSASDQECGQLQKTMLEGRPIGCFLLGGEMRLCLPQIFNNILHEFSLERINRTFDELLIFFSQCTPEQLIEFKMAEILPEDVKACGLITRTNAERLCSALLHRPDRSYCQMIKKKLKEDCEQFRVYHRCFGKSEGICYPDLFAFKERSCIECLECGGLFPPNKFVCHVCKDKPKENRTCHWGFNSSSWRAYIKVAPDESDLDKCNKLLDEIAEKELEYDRQFERELDEGSQLKRKVSNKKILQKNIYSFKFRQIYM